MKKVNENTYIDVDNNRIICKISDSMIIDTGLLKFPNGFDISKEFIKEIYKMGYETGCYDSFREEERDEDLFESFAEAQMREIERGANEEFKELFN